MVGTRAFLHASCGWRVNRMERLTYEGSVNRKQRDRKSAQNPGFFGPASPHCYLFSYRNLQATPPPSFPCMHVLTNQQDATAYIIIIIILGWWWWAEDPAAVAPPTSSHPKLARARWDCEFFAFLQTVVVIRKRGTSQQVCKGKTRLRSFLCVHITVLFIDWQFF